MKPATAAFLTAAGMAVGAGGAAAAPERAHSPKVSAATEAPALNAHWSGYAVSGRKVSFTSVTGSWTEPSATCAPSRRSSLSAVWVGLGGYLSSKLLAQVGTDANCKASGKTRYFAWFEMLPYVAHNIDEPVSAGDTIVGTVKLLPGSLVELQVQDETRHWTFTRRIIWSSPDTTTAEWIVEAPFSCRRFTCRQAPLANFGTVTMHDIAATGNGQPGTLTSPAWTTIPIHLVPCAEPPSTAGTIQVNSPSASRAGAVPGPASADGTTFDIAWERNAGSRASCDAQTSGQIGGTPDHTKG